MAGLIQIPRVVLLLHYQDVCLSCLRQQVLQRGEVGAGQGLQELRSLRCSVLGDITDMQGSEQTRSDSSCIFLPLEKQTKVMCSEEPDGDKDWLNQALFSIYSSSAIVKP